MKQLRYFILFWMLFGGMKAQQEPGDNSFRFQFGMSALFASPNPEYLGSGGAVNFSLLSKPINSRSDMHYEKFRIPIACGILNISYTRTFQQIKLLL